MFAPCFFASLPHRKQTPHPAPAPARRPWTPPDGLDRARPREVRLTGRGRALLVLAACLWLAALVAGVGLEVKARGEAAQQRLFREQAVAANGEVTRLWRARGESRQPWMAYRFNAGGRAFERQVRLRLGTWRGLRVGSSVALRYLPSNPDVNTLAGREPSRLPALLPPLVAATLALGGGLVLLPLRRQKWLLASGRAAQARVTRHAKDKHGTILHFEFAALSGARREGESGPRSSPPPVGATLCVLYDPEHPRRSDVYPLSLVAPANRRSLRPSPASR